MKKTLSIALVLALVVALAVPAVAFAGRGGVKGPNPGRRSAVSGNVGQSPARGHKPPKAPKELRGLEASQVTSDAPAASHESSETSVPMSPGKVKGITNALSRIETTLLRMKANLDQGLRKQLPPGLLRVFEKFFGWLGEPAEFQATWESLESSPTVGPPSTDGVTSEPESELEVTGDPIPLSAPLPFL